MCPLLQKRIDQVLSAKRVEQTDRPGFFVRIERKSAKVFFHLLSVAEHDPNREGQRESPLRPALELP